MRELFTGFLLIGLMGFGGIQASANYVIVERNKWLTAREFVELFGVCSILPGGNFLNVTVMLGDRYQGPLGSVVGLCALMLAPLLILLALAYGYQAFAHLPDVEAAVAGAAAAAAGLIVGTSARLIRGLRRGWPSAVFGSRDLRGHRAAARSAAVGCRPHRAGVHRRRALSASRRRPGEGLRAMTILVQLALTFLGVAFFSIGGASALIPEFYRQIVGIRGWMTASDFAHMVALAQVAPGPNMLIVSLIGWRVAGVPGMLVSTIAIVGPPSLIAFGVGRALDRLKDAACSRRSRAPLRRSLSA